MPQVRRRRRNSGDGSGGRGGRFNAGGDFGPWPGWRWGRELYPNPVQDVLNIRVNNGATGKVAISIFNMAGNRVKGVELEKDGVGFGSSGGCQRVADRALYVVQILNVPSYEHGLKGIYKTIKRGNAGHVVCIKCLYYISRVINDRAEAATAAPVIKSRFHGMDFDL